MCQNRKAAVAATAVIAGAALSLPNIGWGAETKCPTISATTYHSSKSTVAATEKDSKCAITVDGADASTKSIDPIVSCLYWVPFDQLFQVGQSQDRARWVGREIVPLLITPSLSDSDLMSDPQLALPGFPDAQTCGAFFDAFVTAGGEPFDSALHDEVAGQGFLLDELATCLSQARSQPSGPCHMTPDQRLVIEFTTSLGQHSLSLPFF